MNDTNPRARQGGGVVVFARAASRQLQPAVYVAGMRYALAAAVISLSTPAAADCRLAAVLTGAVSVSPLEARGTSVVRSAGMAHGEQFGALRGTLARSREGIRIINRDGVDVGLIDPQSGRVAGADGDDCTSKMVLRYATPTAAILLNDGTPIGTVDGALPR